MLDRELPRVRALEQTLRVQYEEPSRAAAEAMALADVTRQDMQLLRAQRIHEQSYLQASTALFKFRKPAAMSRGAAADPAFDESRLMPPRNVPAPVAHAESPRNEDWTVVGRSEHRSLSGGAVTARSSSFCAGNPRPGKRLDGHGRARQNGCLDPGWCPRMIAAPWSPHPSPLPGEREPVFSPLPPGEGGRRPGEGQRAASDTGPFNDPGTRPDPAAFRKS